MEIISILFRVQNWDHNSHFLQVKGVVTGTCMGHSTVCPFVGYVKQSLFQVYTGTMPQLFLHYINDFRAINAELGDFINFTNFSPLPLTLNSPG